jgi:hypothetical protein
MSARLLLLLLGALLLGAVLLGGEAHAQNTSVTPNGSSVPVQAPQPFVPVAGGYATLSATTSSSRVQLPAGGPNVGITNTGTDTVFVLLGSSSVVVTANTGQPVLAGKNLTIALGTNTYLAGLANSGTQVLSIQVGTGYLSQRNTGTPIAPPVQTITVATPSTQAAGVPFNISGTYTGTVPTGVDFNVDSGSYTGLSSPTISGGNWSSTASDVTIGAGGSHVIGVREQPHTFVQATSGTFTVTGGQAITISTPSTQTAGVGFNISGTYSSTAPTGIDFRVNSGSYAALSSPTIGGGNWSSTANDVIIGSPGTYTAGVREQPSTGITATSGNFTVNSGGACSHSLNFAQACNSQYGVMGFM